MSQPEVLYHYCSSETFLRIIESGEVWLSFLSLSNDTLEGKLVSTVLRRLAIADALSSEQQERLFEMLNVYEAVFSGCGFCLSAEPDLL